MTVAPGGISAEGADGGAMFNISAPGRAVATVVVVLNAAVERPRGRTLFTRRPAHPNRGRPAVATAVHVEVDLRAAGTKVEWNRNPQRYGVFRVFSLVFVIKIAIVDAVEVAAGVGTPLACGADIEADVTPAITVTELQLGDA
ncbi:hypothetical protein SDC9_149017 [bioreactor metagenome]|uniref:Uncharacterized protein n=1 Tax=bioreactor metagenome TaxID=1076179 RepID=A0A645EIG6_9ZZZZ